MAQWIMAGVGSVFMIIWLELFVIYHSEFRAYIRDVPKGQYFLPSLFFIGFGFMRQFRVDTYNEKSLGKLRLFSEVYGQAKARMYFETDLAAQITYVLTLVPFGCFVGVLSQLEIGFLIIFAGLFLVFYLQYDMKLKVEKRREAIMGTFPHVLSKIALLINAGLPFHEVIGRIAYAKDELLYQEFGKMQDEIRNGVPEKQAIQNLADRCGVNEIRRFSTILIQNLEKGSSQMASSLTEMSVAIWQERKSGVRQRGEQISAQLMLPILIIFIGIMLMVLVPMFSSLG